MTTHKIYAHSCPTTEVMATPEYKSRVEGYLEEALGWEGMIPGTMKITEHPCDEWPECGFAKGHYHMVATAEAQGG